MANSSVVQLADLALVWNVALASADLAMIDGDLASDRGLETAVLLSLFTDRRADDDDVPPTGDPTDRRGWWADEFADVEGDLVGSRLWLLSRAQATNDTAQLAELYAKEALQWMLDDQVVAGITAAATIATINGAKALSLAVTLQQPGKDPVTYKYAGVWAHVQEDM